jgi:NCAIR mutase (PurE)-related protein
LINFIKGFIESKASIIKKRKKIKKGEKIRIKYITVIKANSKQKDKLITVMNALKKLDVNSLITRCSQLWQIEIKGKHNLEILENILSNSISST